MHPRVRDVGVSCVQQERSSSDRYAGGGKEMYERHPCQSRFFRQHLTCEDWCPVPFIKQERCSRRNSKVVSPACGSCTPVVGYVATKSNRKDKIVGVGPYIEPSCIRASTAAFSSGVWQAGSKGLGLLRGSEVPSTPRSLLPEGRLLQLR